MQCLHNARKEKNSLDMLLISVILTVLILRSLSEAQQIETVTGTIFCNNDFSLYINGEFIAEDPIPTGPHNAVNVSFRIQEGKNITFAIDARDLASNETGLEFDNRCVGSGGLRAIFSNGVVTNDKWVCTTYHYGPVNWKECYGAQTVRSQSLQIHPGCRQNSTPPLEGCFARYTTKPDGWTSPGFDDSRWEYAIEWDESYVGWGARPSGCNDPNTIISPELDPNGENITCPENINWGDSKFIWRPDLDLDNHLLCRYTLSFGGSSGSNTLVTNISVLFFFVSVVLTMNCY